MTTPGDASVASPRARGVVGRLRGGDERAVARIVADLHPAMLRVARALVPTPSMAEEAVQEAWLGVVSGLERFEGRSSLRTWVLRITVNRALHRRRREGRSVPFSSLAADEADRPERAVPEERFLGPGHRWAGHWAAAPQPLPEDALLGRETLGVLLRAVDGLPPAQRAVIILRDIEGLDAAEVCRVLEVTDANQRVLLHRARSRVRAALEAHLEPVR